MRAGTQAQVPTLARALDSFLFFFPLGKGDVWLVDFPFFFLIFIFINFSSCFWVCVSLCVGECKCPGKPEENVKFPEVRTASCMSRDVSVENQTRILCKNSLSSPTLIDFLETGSH